MAIEDLHVVQIAREHTPHGVPSGPTYALEIWGNVVRGMGILAAPAR